MDPSIVNMYSSVLYIALVNVPANIGMTAFPEPAGNANVLLVLPVSVKKFLSSCVAPAGSSVVLLVPELNDVITSVIAGVPPLVDAYWEAIPNPILIELIAGAGAMVVTFQSEFPIPAIVTFTWLVSRK